VTPARLTEKRLGISGMRTLTIDALPLMGQGGISNYNRPLFEELIAHAPSEWQVELIFRLGFLGSRRELYRKYRKRLNCSRVVIRKSALPDRLLVKRWEKNFHVNGNKAERNNNVFLATTDLVPRCKNAKVGWIVYDVTPLIVPQFFKINHSDYFQEMKNRLKRTDFIIAISKTTKKDIVEKFNYPENKITVIYPGAPFCERKESKITFKFKRPYICYLGALAQNKNVDGLLRIFSRCVHEHKIDYDMILTGKDFCGKDYWDQLSVDLKIEDRVHMIGWVSEEERDAILTNAAMLWHFSWYEGFGLPVLEAAARGIPVLHSNRGAVTEILRNLDQQIDPANEKEAAAKAVYALKSEKICQNWKAVGYERAKDFRWSDSARKLVNCIETHTQ